MRGWQVVNPGTPIQPAELDDPHPAPGELLVAVDACGVCRTDLHVSAGDLPPHRPKVVPGHEVVGHVAALGDGVTGFAPGDRVGVAWLRSTARELGAASAGPASDGPPEPLDSAILFAPAGSLVPVALRALDRGGRLAVAGIYLTPIPPLDYDRDLFQERTLRSVSSNTREDGRSLLAFAGSHRLQVSVDPYPMNRADEALAALAAGHVSGAAVLLP